MSEDSKLSELRNKIDGIDAELLQLLGKRARLVLEVGKYKGDNNGNNFIRSGREAKMLRELLKKSDGHFPETAIRALWRGIISASLSIENGLKVAIPAGAGFELHRMVVEYFGSFTEYTEYESDNEILDAIDKHTIGIFTLNSSWWLNLAEKSHSNLKVFAKLADGVYAVARLETEESGDDRTIAITRSLSHKGHVIATHGQVDLVELKGFQREVIGAEVIGNYGL